MTAAWAAAEMAGADIRDPRRIKSLSRLCARLADQPELSFSAACGAALRQAARRIFGQRDTTVEKLLAGHVQQTARRCRAYPLVLAVQDTTAVEYNRHQATVGLGPITDQATGRGFFAHTAYAVAPDGTPLGLLHAQFWARDPAEYGKSQNRRQRLPEEKESRKWRLGLEGVERALPPAQAVLLVQDRESDVFDFMAAPRRPNTHLLLRAGQPRAVEVPGAVTGVPGERGTLFAVAAASPVVAELLVRIGRQAGQPEREAHLTVRCTPLLVQPPKRIGMPPAGPQMWVILVTETAPPAGVAPVEWVLLTTLPVPDGETACEMVRHYARRWTIERLHYTLKTGLRVERLQHDTVTALMHALALYYVVAWRLMYLTHLARTDPERPAAGLLAPDELAVLTQVTAQPVTTVRQAVRAIAQLGGFEDYRRAPEPGVKVVWQGLRRLAAMTEGWRLAHAAICPTYHEI
jgi:hypothetical protein